MRRLSVGFVAACALGMLWSTGCDIPSEAPSFAINPTIKTPLVFSEGLRFLGPGPGGEPAIIDTTSPDFDSLFTVNPSDRTIYVVREIDRIELDGDGSLFDPVSVAPVAFSNSLGAFESNTFSGSTSQTLDIDDGPPASTPPLPHTVNNGEIYIPGQIENILPGPTSGLLTLSSSNVLIYGFSADGAPMNQLSIQMTNNSGQTLTDGSFASNSIPRAELVNTTGQVVTSAPFDRAPATGQSTVANIDLANVDVPAGSRIRLDVGTTSGLGPITGNPTSLELVVDASASRYRSIVFENVEAQTDIFITESFAISGSRPFNGVVVSSGVISLVISNSLPVSFSVQSIRLENETAFGPYPAGTAFASASGSLIPANGVTTIQMPVNDEGISSNSRVVVTLSSPGSPNATSLGPGDGLTIDLQADLTVGEVFLTPDGETFASSGAVAFDIPDIELVGIDDFVELAAGSLEITDLYNEYGVGFDEVIISFPDILRAPYRPADSLVVALNGIGPASGPHTSTTDLANTQIRAGNGQVRYSVRATAEETGAERSIDLSDALHGVAAARDLVPRSVEASIQPFSVAVTADANSDNLLDVLSDAEAQVVSVDGINDFYEFGLEGLQLVGSELVLDITTDIGADIELYCTLAGVRRSGEVVYLGGLGQNAVLPTDSLAGRFAAGGQIIDASQLLKLSIAGSPLGKSVERRVVFNDDNSNIGEFVANLPEEVRVVAQAVIGRENGRVILSDPFILMADVSLTLPLSLRGDFALTHDFEADLSSLDQLTDPTASVEINVAEIALEYTNAIPVGVDAVFHFLDASGQETISLPAAGDPRSAFGAAPSDELGFSNGSTTGRVVFPLDADRLRALSRARTISMELLVDTGNDSIGRIRANDRVEFAMSGNFDIRINIGN